MPFIPPTITKGIPAANNVLSGTTNGTIVTYDPSPSLDAIQKQIANIAYYVSGAGTAATNEPGSMTAIMSDQAKQLNAINATLAAIFNTGKDVPATTTGGVGSLISSIDKLNSTLVELTAQHALQVADQVNHNEFVEQTTNTARKEAGKEEIKVADADYKAKVQKGVTNIGTVQAVTKVAGIAGGIVSNAANTAVSLAESYIADTTIGKFVLTKIAQAKAWAKQTQADADAKVAEIQKAADTSNQSKSGQSAPNPPVVTT